MVKLSDITGGNCGDKALVQKVRYHTIKRRSGAYGHDVVFWVEGETLNVLRYFHTSQDWEKNVEDLPGART